MDNIIHQSLDGIWKLAVIHQKDFVKIALPTRYDAVVNTGSMGAIILDAAVPGNFEIDLEKAGKISDPFFGANVLKMFEWEDCHVIYAKKFMYKGETGKKPELVFEGIDTVADIYLNGVFLSHTANMYLTHRIDATERNTPSR